MSTALLVAIDHLAEAMKMPNEARIKRKLVRALKRKISRTFAEQGRLVLRAFAKRRAKLFEAAVPVPTLYDWILDALQLATFDAHIDGAARLALITGATTLIKAFGGQVFDLGNPRAIEYLKQVPNRSKKINDATFESIRDLLTEGISEGRSYSSLAREIRRQFDGFAGKLPQKHIRDRAELVAVTEIGDAYNQGVLIQASGMQERGMEMEKYWATVGDDRVSDGCAENEAAGWIDIDEDFPSGDDAPLRFPGCRCSLLTRRKESA